MLTDTEVANSCAPAADLPRAPGVQMMFEFSGIFERKIRRLAFVVGAIILIVSCWVGVGTKLIISQEQKVATMRAPDTACSLAAPQPRHPC
jgi:hypothetical protein